MDYGMKKGDCKVSKMGSSTNSNASKITTLQDRKKAIEEALAKHNKELRKICIQEAELTGIMPIEFPLEPGETAPVFRRRIGTSFQLPQNLINNFNNNEEEISALELEMQVLMKLAEAALGLANENNGNKTARRTHMADYQQHKLRYNALEEKLHYLKTHLPVSKETNKSLPNINQQPKQRKKPRSSEQETTTNADFMDPFGKPVFRHSLRSLQYPAVTQDNLEYRYTLHGHQKLGYRNSDTTSLNENVPQYMKEEEPLGPNLCKLNINGLQDYPERQEASENLSGHMQNQFIHSQSTNFFYKQYPPQYMNPSYTLPHVSRHSPQLPSQTLPNHYHQDFHKYNNNTVSSPNNLYRQPSPIASSGSSIKYYPYPGQLNYKPFTGNHSPHDTNPHQIQPHQQYEHNVMATGLGGYWKRSLVGEMIWCNTSNEASVHKDKRFGSLDRRKNKRIQKRLSPNVDPKSATLAAMPLGHEQNRLLTTKHSQIVNRQQQDSRQLVRTQSLGSVGVQTVGSVSPSEESCSGSERSYNEHNNTIRKNKQKEWYETSLDGPANSISRSHSTIPSIPPEDKYSDFPSPVSSQHVSVQMVPSPAQQSSPQASKILEIPAESNPSPRIAETKLEMFNNNIPKNGTVVQQALWKPYHEETKPFEMSDFYKYSTKFKKSPQKITHVEPTHAKSHSVGFRNLPSPPSTIQSNANDNYEDDNMSVIQKGIYQPLQPMKCQAFSPVNKGSPKVAGLGNNLNTSLDLSVQLTTNIAENFSAEMNAWYQNHEHQTENNNATLV